MQTQRVASNNNNKRERQQQQQQIPFATDKIKKTPTLGKSNRYRYRIQIHRQRYKAKGKGTVGKGGKSKLTPYERKLKVESKEREDKVQ